MRFESLSPRGNFTAMCCLMKDFGAKENKVVRESGNQRSAVGIRVQDEPEQQKRGEDPREPLDLYGQNEKNVNDLVGIKSGKGEKQRRDQHAVGKIGAEEKCGDRCPDHADEEIKG